MTPERWEKVGELYHAALELDAAAREMFLTRACANDEALRHEIESLLAAEPEMGNFIAAPALADAAEMLAVETESLAGKMLGNYRILSRLGRGGMGEVFLARDQRLKRQVAIKLLPTEFINDDNRVRRFEREAQAISALNHPNIITIHEIGTSDSAHFLVMEFVDGWTLRQGLAEGKLTLSLTLSIVAQVANALAAAHEAGVIHRDIKPENVMVRRDGLVKVLDFGLAKMTELRPAACTDHPTEVSDDSMTSTAPGAVMGTPRYMSPEQARGLEVDARTDIFSLGVMLYEMIAKRPPFTGETQTDVVLAIVAEEPQPLSEAPAELQRIVSKALRKNRESRYLSARELLSDLNKLRKKPSTESNQELATAEPHHPLQTAEVRGNTADEVATRTLPTDSRFTRLIPHRRRLIVAAGIMILLMAAALFYFVNRHPALSERDTVLLAEFENKSGEQVFDGVLRRALAVQLEQTPFFNLFADERVRETLRYMGREPDTRLSREIAREICQRQGIKAMLFGSIARLERNYSIILEAFDSRSGETIASALIEAEGKDQVLRALGRAATQLRERLGESLASVQKFDAPLEQATTSSLEAFQAWSQGLELARTGRSGAVISAYEHAIKLDPNFAKAYVSLALAHNSQNETEMAAQYAERAFKLRDRVSEREKFDIDSLYHANVTGDLHKAIAALELWRQTYPREYSPVSRLAPLYRLIGQFEKSQAAARAAQQINPRAYVPFVSLGTALVQMNRFDEAETVIRQAIEQKLATTTSRRDLYQLAVLKGDVATMQQQLDWATGRTDEYWAFHWRAQSASYAGRLREAREAYRRAAELTAPQQPERAIWFTEEALLRDAVSGQCRQIKDAAAPPRVTRISTQPYIPNAASRALTLTWCGNLMQAQALADEIAQHNPQATLAHMIWLPIVRAAIELQRGAPDRAVQILELVRSYEPATLFWQNYLRGLAYLRLNKGGEAAAEFQTILKHRGWDTLSPLYPLAQLGLARAAALNGDQVASQTAYEGFLHLWENADADIPLWQEARREYEKLK